MSSLISVIIPVYNAEKYLDMCVSSVLSQEDVETELLLIDDGSCDGSPGICDKLGAEHENIRVFHTENRGVVKARNLGLEKASGKYIAFLDNDDELYPGSLKLLTELIEKYSADIAIGKKLVIDEKGQKRPTSYQREIELWAGTDGLCRSLEDHPATHTVWGKLYRAEFLRDVRFAARVQEDSNFIFDCMVKEPTVVLADEYTYIYHLRDTSASRSRITEKNLDIIRFAEKKNALIKEKYPMYEKLAGNMMIKAHMAMLKKLMVSDSAEYKEQEKESLRYIKQHREAYIPSNSFDDRLFRDIVHGMYYPRKLLLKLIKKG